MKWLQSSCLAATMISVMAPVALAQDIYRQGEPPVLNALPSADQPCYGGNLIPNYRRLQSPRLALFWDRVLDGRPSEWKNSHRLTFHESRSGKEDEERQWRLASQRSQTGTADRGYASDEFRFCKMVTEAGIQLVTSDIILRLTLNDREEGALDRQNFDQQRLEMTALRQYADWILEIDTVSGIERSSVAGIRIIDLSTGQIRGSSTVALTAERWNAVASGFERQSYPLSAGPAIACKTLQLLTSLGS